MTASQVYALAARAGFDRQRATTMTALALRESGGDPTRHNLNPATHDDSWGLWQINWGVPEVKLTCQRLGVLTAAELLDPATNARIAFALWGNDDKNLNTAWYIDIPGCPQHDRKYQLGYESHLPEAQAAALAYRA